MYDSGYTLRYAPRKRVLKWNLIQAGAFTRAAPHDSNKDGAFCLQNKSKNK